MIWLTSRFTLFPYTTLFRSVITSGMIEADGDVEVLDKNVYIATVSEGGKLEMEMRLKRGRGYASGDRKSTRLNSSHRTISYAVFCLKKNNVVIYITACVVEV